MPRFRPVDRLIVTHGLSSFCLGLVFPYTAIHLADRPGVGTGGVALFYGAAGIANLTVALLLTAGVLKLPRVTLGVLGTVLWFCGYLALPFVGSHPATLAVGVTIGCGQGGFLAAIVPLVNSLVTADERRKVFARRYAVLNATLAAGSLVAGALTLFLPRSVIPYFFVANAVGILPLTIAMLAAGRHARGADEKAEETDEGPALPLTALARTVLPAALVQLAVFLFGFSQFEATSPLVSERLMDMGLFMVSLMLAVNVVVIVSVQGWMTRVLEDRPEIDGLRIAVVLWTAGYVVAGAMAFLPYGFRLTGLLVYAVLFALGECAYSCSFHPWLISLVPDRELTRANALANSMMGVGNFAGPSIGVALAASGQAPVVWLGLALCCTTITVGTGLLARRQAAKPAPAAA
ncbi:MFS transporter [Streptomyces griseus]|uniref:MFS transporter n=1 Tax=Streptomyces griseus TaxID=1911 RepID=UPI000D1B6AD5|nr:MFS transporter [Streptomyces griseus]